MDLDVEHDNKSFKTNIHSFRGEITDKSISRVSQSIEMSNAILASHDKSACVRKPSGRHTKNSNEDDVKILVEEFQQMERTSAFLGGATKLFQTQRRIYLMNWT